jgi:tetratricopeptide (TPR) repeat protein
MSGMSQRFELTPKNNMMKNWLSPLCLVLILNLGLHAQQETPNGWSYEELKPGKGPKLTTGDGALTHNQLLTDNGQVLVSTYQIGVPDYQRIAALSPQLQQAFSVMQEGGKYRFYIPVKEFQEAMRSKKALNLTGEKLTWEMELIELLPPLPDGARVIREVLQQESATVAIQRFQELTETGEAFLGEWEVNQIGYFFLNSGHKAEALLVMQYNTKNHPNSANAFDSLAETYFQNGQESEAKQSYERSLEINPDNANARKMLSKLK